MPLIAVFVLESGPEIVTNDVPLPVTVKPDVLASVILPFATDTVVCILPAATSTSLIETVVNVRPVSSGVD